MKFKKNIRPIGLSEDFWYMINGGGWANPEKFLEDEDAKRVREAIKIIEQYESEGIEQGYFEEM